MSEILVERPRDGVALVRLNRPEARNALSLGLRAELHDRFVELTDDETVRAIVVTGDERAFAAGSDLREIAELDVPGAMRRPAHRLARPIRDCPKPVIAAISGLALGGGLELALLADILIAGETARLGLPEVRVGVLPGGGGTQRLVRAVGQAKAMLLALTGEPVSGDEAERIGLVSAAVPDAEVLDRALDIAAQIAALPPIAVQQIKEAIRLGPEASMDAALALERKSFQLLFATEDQKEGARAFLEKRPPRFEGR